MPSDIDAIHHRAFEKSVREIKALKSNLPEDAVIALAREVLLRVSEQANPTGDEVAQQIENLARALISDDKDAGSNLIREVRADGASLDEVYLIHLAGAARKLGDWWVEDRVSLTDVTVGTGRIYAIMRVLARLFHLPPVSGKKAALFSAVPDETHTIGVKMAADLFRKNGWDITLKIDPSHDQLVEEIKAQKPRIVGFSAGGEHATKTLARLIIAARLCSPATKIFVSGQVVNEARNLVKLMGPDAIAFEFEEVEAEINRLWRETSPQ